MKKRLINGFLILIFYSMRLLSMELSQNIQKDNLQSCQAAPAFAQYFVTPQWKIAPEFLSLLQVFQPDVPLNTVHDVNAYLQKNFLRRPDQERYDMSNRISPENKQHVLKWAIEHQFISPVFPQKNEYDSVCFHGSTALVMHEKIKYFKYLLDQSKIKMPRKIFFLVGERVLTHQEKKQFCEPQNCTSCVYESDVVRHLFSGFPENAPNPEIIVAPHKQIEQNGKMMDVRPNTADTIIYWLKKNAVPSQTLFISYNPFIVYQHLVLLRCIHNVSEWSSQLIETVGPSADARYLPENAADVFMDSVARIFYELNDFHENGKK